MGEADGKLRGGHVCNASMGKDKAFKEPLVNSLFPNPLLSTLHPTFPPIHDTDTQPLLVFGH